MIVKCPKCGASNNVPDASKQQTKYLCGRCKTRLLIPPTVPGLKDGLIVDHQVPKTDEKTKTFRVAGIVLLCLILAALVALAGWGIAAHIKDISAPSVTTLSIVKSSDNVLRQIAEPVNVDYIGEEEQRLAESMTKIMQNEDGYGLAAPQVGVSKRIMVIRLERASSPEDILVMLNPEIIEREGMVSGPEWSLSVPGSRDRPIQVTRSERIVVKYWTIGGAEAVLEEEGSNARVIQQEIDNLNGILITDYAKSFNITPQLLAAIAILLIMFLLWTRTSLLDDTGKSTGVSSAFVVNGQVAELFGRYRQSISGLPLVALLYLLGITVAEVFPFFYSGLGTLLAIVILAVLVIHILKVHEYHTRRFLICLLILPFSLLVFIITPAIHHVLPQSGTLIVFIVSYVVQLAAAVAIIRIVKLTRQDLYLGPGKIRVQLLIALTGIIIGPALYFLYRPEPINIERGWPILGATAVSIIVAAAVEELVYRGILQRTSTWVLGRWGLIYVSAAFMFFHIDHVSGANLSIASIPFIFIVALFYSWVVGKTGSLLGVTLSHIICNVIVFMVLAPIFL